MPGTYSSVYNGKWLLLLLSHYTVVPVNVWRVYMTMCYTHISF